MSRRYQFVFEALAIASIIVVADLLLGLVVLLVVAGASLFVIASNILTVEFGAMLILGGCLMARQPLIDEKRHDSSGKPTRAWKLALWGRQVLLCSVFVLLFALVFALLEANLWL